MQWHTGFNFLTFHALWKTWLQFKDEALKSTMEVGEKSKTSVKIPIKITHHGDRPVFLTKLICRKISMLIEISDPWNCLRIYYFWANKTHRACEFYVKHKLNLRLPKQDKSFKIYYTHAFFSTFSIISWIAIPIKEIAKLPLISVQRKFAILYILSLF